MRSSNGQQVGISAIGTYIPPTRIQNSERALRFELNDEFISEKIGITSTSISAVGENCSDLCVKAFEDLKKKHEIDISEIEVILVVTQTPDVPIPHASAILHGKLSAPETCACFDVSLGCSGYVYGLSVIKSFMESNGFTRGLLFTADPYSKIVDSEDRNTSLLFGDAATATLITNDYKYQVSNFIFGTDGQQFDKLIIKEQKLHMDGRGIFNFAAKFIPKEIEEVIKKANLSIEEIDYFLIHQGSKFIVDTIRKRLGAPSEKVPFDIYEYGNTVSSSIPLLLEKIFPSEVKMVASGFGVGLSWASCLIESRKNS